MLLLMKENPLAWGGVHGGHRRKAREGGRVESFKALGWRAGAYLGRGVSLRDVC